MEYDGVSHPKKCISWREVIAYASYPTLIYEENILKTQKKGVADEFGAIGPGLNLTNSCPV